MKEKAYKVSVKNWPEADSIHKTENAAKAKYQAWHGANSMGYYIKFGDLVCRRAKEFDFVPKEKFCGHGLGIDYANTLLQEKQWTKN